MPSVLAELPVVLATAWTARVHPAGLPVDGVTRLLGLGHDACPSRDSDGPFAFPGETA